MARKFQFSIDRRLTNWVIKILLKLNLAPEDYYLLTVPGRLTGMPHSIPVVLVDEGNQRYLVAPYGVVAWVKNARTAGQVHLSGRHIDDDFLLFELPPNQAAPILKEYLRQWPITAPYFDANLESPLSEFVLDAVLRPVFELVSVSDP